MYLVTGATGFIGKHLVGLLLKRGGPVFVLVRQASRGKVQELAHLWTVDDDRLVPVIGDVGEPGCGLDARALRKLKAAVRHVFHLAAVYDMTADLETARRGNVEGTRHVLQVAAKLGAQLITSSSPSPRLRGLFPRTCTTRGSTTGIRTS
jgi:thioester reductase-like protein